MKKIFWILCALVLLTGCAKETKEQATTLLKTGSLELQYAKQYSVDYYEKGYVHIHVEDGRDYVLIPENEEENNLGLEDPVYIHKPCNHIYLAASSAMDLFLQLDALDSIATCSTQAKDYAMEEVKRAIESEEIQYVGKYSAPDYEKLLSRNCNLAIESTMIGHSPKIKEQLEHVNIPVFVERSSYEENPIGRLEWIKLYGVLTGKEKAARDFFEQELLKINQLVSGEMKEVGEPEEAEEREKKSVAFFSITSTGAVTVRKPGDYLCKMIEMAGGRYALEDLPVEEENALSTINIGMEDFYKEAQDADILIYNGSIDGGVNNLDEFLKKQELLKDFRAVREGNVWSTSLNMFQESSKIAQVIADMAHILNGDALQSDYLKHLE